MPISRRQALVAIGTVATVLHGTDVKAEQAKGLTLALDAFDVIVVRYRGETVALPVQEVMEALRGVENQHYPGQSPSQFPLRK